MPEVNGNLCQATVNQTYLHITRGADLLGPLLLTVTTSAHNYSIFRQNLHSILAWAGKDDSNIKGHSFRRGGATRLIRIGVPVK